MIGRPKPRQSTVVGHLIRSALVLPRTKVLYLPTTKVACTALKFLFAEAEGTLRADLMSTLPTAAPTPTHTIHNHAISGLTKFFDLSESEQNEILTSDEWWRVGAIRNPYARMYSSWENRILLRAPSHYIKEFGQFPDRTIDGRIDIVETFTEFMRVVVANPTSVDGDDHFTTQSVALRPGKVNLTHLLRVDAEGELAAFADALSRRVNKHLELKRLNEGLGIKYSSVVTAESGSLIEQYLAEDFTNFGFERETFPPERDPILLTDKETKLVVYSRQVSQRLDVAAEELGRRVGARYALAEIKKRALEWIR